MAIFFKRKKQTETSRPNPSVASISTPAKMDSKTEGLSNNEYLQEAYIPPNATVEEKLSIFKSDDETKKRVLRHYHVVNGNSLSEIIAKRPLRDLAPGYLDERLEQFHLAWAGLFNYSMQMFNGKFPDGPFEEVHVPEFAYRCPLENNENEYIQHYNKAPFGMRWGDWEARREEDFWLNDRLYWQTGSLKTKKVNMDASIYASKALSTFAILFAKYFYNPDGSFYDILDKPFDYQNDMQLQGYIWGLDYIEAIGLHRNEEGLLEDKTGFVYWNPLYTDLQKPTGETHRFGDWRECDDYWSPGAAFNTPLHACVPSRNLKPRSYSKEYKEKYIDPCLKRNNLPTDIIMEPKYAVNVIADMGGNQFLSGCIYNGVTHEAGELRCRTHFNVEQAVYIFKNADLNDTRDEYYKTTDYNGDPNKIITSLSYAFDPKGGYLVPCHIEGDKTDMPYLPVFSLKGVKVEKDGKTQYYFYPYGSAIESRIGYWTYPYNKVEINDIGGKRTEYVADHKHGEFHSTFVDYAEPLLIYDEDTTDEELGDQLVNAYRMMGLSFTWPTKNELEKNDLYFGKISKSVEASYKFYHGTKNGGKYNTKEQLEMAYKYGFDLGFVATGGKYEKGIFINYGYDNNPQQTNIPITSTYQPLILLESAPLSYMDNWAEESKPTPQNLQKMKNNLANNFEKFSPYYSMQNGGISTETPLRPRQLPDNIIQKLKETKENEEWEELNILRYE